MAARAIALLTALGIIVFAGTGCRDERAPTASDSTPENATPGTVTAIDRALAESRITSDPNGQWATTAVASSAFGDGVERAPFSPLQATGAPNVVQYGTSSMAWTSKRAGAGIEWLQVGFEKPVHATALRVRQTFAPGAIIKIELLDEASVAHTVFDEIDETHYPTWNVAWFERTFERTDYRVTGAKITLNSITARVWHEIDAVQLVGSD